MAEGDVHPEGVHPLLLCQVKRNQSILQIFYRNRIVIRIHIKQTEQVILQAHTIQLTEVEYYFPVSDECQQPVSEGAAKQTGETWTGYCRRAFLHQCSGNSKISVESGSGMQCVCDR